MRRRQSASQSAGHRICLQRAEEQWAANNFYKRCDNGMFIDALQAQPWARWSSPASAAAHMSLVVLYLGGNELAG